MTVYEYKDISLDWWKLGLNPEEIGKRHKHPNQRKKKRKRNKK